MSVIPELNTEKPNIEVGSSVRILKDLKTIANVFYEGHQFKVESIWTLKSMTVYNLVDENNERIIEVPFYVVVLI